MAKSKYVVIQDFTDLQDGKKVYVKDDAFPRPVNKKIEDERIKQLLGKDNRQGRPVIKEVTESEKSE